jgi:hypothetical protein
MSFNSYCDTQTPSTEEPSNSPPPSSGGSPELPCVDSGGSLVDAGGVSPTIVVGDVNVGLTDTADVLTGGTLGGGVHDVADIGDTLNNLDVLDAVADTDISKVLTDTADLNLDALNGGGDSSGDSGGSPGSGDSDTGGLICQLVGSLGGAGGGILDIDLSDVGAILGDGCLPDLPIDGVADCILGQSSLLDVAGLGDVLGDHA